MGNVFVDVGMSLDGFIAGTNRSPENPMGGVAQTIHTWLINVHTWRERQSLEGGERNHDDEIANETFSRAGAYIMGRRMFDEGELAWPDPPPFQKPVFVLTNHSREPWERQGGTTFYFVTGGIERALELANDAAEGKDVHISGGAHTIQQYLNAGLVDDIQIHLAPAVLGDGLRLFENLDEMSSNWATDRVVPSDSVTHLRYLLS
jgi:dihydrofolate reductase